MYTRVMMIVREKKLDDEFWLCVLCMMYVVVIVPSLSSSRRLRRLIDLRILSESRLTSSSINGAQGVERGPFKLF